MNTTKIQGVIRLTSPMSIASPGDARYDFDRDNFVYGDKAAVTCTRTRKDRIIVHGRDEDAPPIVEVPVCPPNSIRGRLRRRAAARILSALGKRGIKVDLNTWMVLKCGAANGYPDSKLLTAAEVKESAAHPYLGLFGGGPTLIKSCLRTDTAYPICPATIQAGLIPERYHGAATKTDRLTQVSMFRRVDDLRSGIPEDAKIIEDCDETIGKWMEMTASPDPSDETKAAVRGVTGWSSIEYVIAGTPFLVSVDIDSFDEAQIGLAMISLCDMLNEQKLGGKVALGSGRFNVSDMAIECNGKRHKLLKDDQVPYELNMADEVVASFVHAAEEALETMDAEALMKFCKPEKDPEEKAKQKKEKKDADQAAREERKKAKQ